MFRRNDLRLTDEFVTIDGGLLMPRNAWLRRNAPWWKRIFMRRS